MKTLYRNARLILPLILGLLLGCASTSWYFQTNKAALPKIRLSGRVKLDTASHPNPYFMNALYLTEPIQIEDTLYLQFQSDAELNAAIGKMVMIEGHLRSVSVSDQEQVTEFVVSNLETIDEE